MEFYDNKIEGNGTFHWFDGRVYKGSFANDLKHGYGKMIWNDGKIYEGGWLEGVQHGEGKIVYIKNGRGNTKKGVWENGVFVSQ